MPDKRSLLREIFDCAVTSAYPDRMLAQHLSATPCGRIICLAAGKAAAAMAAATERHYLNEIGIEPTQLMGTTTTRHGHSVATRRIR